MTWWDSRKHVLVPVDDSEASYSALETALEMTDAANVTVVHVLEPIAAAVIHMGGDTEVEDTRRLRDARAYLDKQLASREIEGVRVEVMLGSPSISIVDFADEHDVDLIILSSHGRTGLKRIFLGSVAESVIRHAPCPTLVLRREG